MSPGAPNLPIALDAIFPSDTTSKTPKAANAIPMIFATVSPSFRITQPSKAMNTSVVATIQAVVLASDVCNAFD